MIYNLSLSLNVPPREKLLAIESTQGSIDHMQGSTLIAQESHLKIVNQETELCHASTQMN